MGEAAATWDRRARISRALLFTRNSALGGYIAVTIVGATQFVHGAGMNETIVGLCGAWLAALLQFIDPRWTEAP